MPFASAYKLASHFDAHGHEFGAASEEEYERIADAFMSQTLHPNLYGCIRTNADRDRLLLDGIIGYFGIAYGVLTLRTFYTKSQEEIAHAGGAAKFVARKCLEKR